MIRIGTLLLSAGAAFLLGACAGPVSSDCRKQSICPILIYEKWPGYFATYPDTVTVKTGGGPQTLVWTFADASKYKFMGSTDTVKGDGIELIDANGSKIGLTSCFVTKHSRPAFRPTQEGPYYRCEVVQSKPFSLTRYLVRFHAMDGTPRQVDPGIISTSDADGDDDSDDGKFPSILATFGTSVTLPAKTAAEDGFRVIWDSGSDTLMFRRVNDPMIFKDTAMKEVDIQPCTPSTTADGRGAADKGRYYACIFTTPLKPLSFTYEAKFSDTMNPAQTRSGTVQRAP